MVRNKTAFHYGGLDMGEAVNNLAPDERMFHIAQHPVNALYWVGSAVVFRAIFAEISALADPGNLRGHRDRVEHGLRLLLNDVNEANPHMHEVLYGLIKGLIEEVRGQPLDAGDVTTIDDVPTPRGVAICPWVYILPATSSL